MRVIYENVTLKDEITEYEIVGDTSMYCTYVHHLNPILDVWCILDRNQARLQLRTWLKLLKPIQYRAKQKHVNKPCIKTCFNTYVIRGAHAMCFMYSYVIIQVGIQKTCEIALHNDVIITINPPPGDSNTHNIYSLPKFVFPIDNQRDHDFLHYPSLDFLSIRLF